MTSAPGIAAALLAGGGIAAAVLMPDVDIAGTAAPPLLAAGLVLVAGGLLAGFLSGLFGIGGALVTLPVFHLVLPWLGVPPAGALHGAVLAALVAMVPTVVAATIPQWRHGFVDMPTLRLLVPAVVCGALLGSLLSTFALGAALALAFAAQGLWCGTRMLVGCRTDRPSLPARVVRRLPPRLVVLSFGSFCAAVGLGCGPMATPFLVGRGLDFRRAVATASVLSLAMATTAGLVFLGVSLFGTQGAFGGPSWGAGLLVGAVATAVAGSGARVGLRWPVERLRHGVGAVYVAGALAVAIPTLARL